MNTARIAHLVLRNSELRIGVDFAGDEVVAKALGSADRKAVLLFPGKDSIDPRELAEPVTLVVIDGTWSQASKLIEANPRLRELPRIALKPQSPSEYRIRRQPQPQCLSTIEALAAILGELEGSAAGMERMLVPFQRMVEQQLQHGASGSGRPKGEKNEQPALPMAVKERPGDVVIACGEANAWTRSSDGPLPEIVHWVAERPETGARFEALIRPRHELSPSCAHHLEIELETIQQGEGFEDFARRWSDFAGPDAIVLTWGGFAGDVLEREGVRVGTRVDLRIPTLRHLKSRAGALEVCVRELGAAPPEQWARGRAGRRLALLGAVYAGLGSRSCEGEL